MNDKTVLLFLFIIFLMGMFIGYLIYLPPTPEPTLEATSHCITMNPTLEFNNDLTNIETDQGVLKVSNMGEDNYMVTMPDGTTTIWDRDKVFFTITEK